jgi:glycosyltransferase involved in cell wall biosynthesis
MKICFILSDSNTKGANGAFLELIDSLNKNRFSPYIILPSAGHIVHELKIRNIPFKIIYNKWWMHEKISPQWKWIARLFINSIAFPRVCCQISKWQCDIIYTNTITVGIGLFASIILRKPHIFHVHEFGYIDHRLIFDFGKIISLWLANKFTRYFIFVSHAVANEYSGFIKKSKSKVIYQSVTVSRNKPKLSNIKKHKLQCVIIGRLTENKGQNEAIEAVDILIKEGLDVGLWIIGEGEQRYKLFLEKNVESKNIKDYIYFYGCHNNPSLFTQEGDVALMCSRCEAFGRVTIEAMLIGKPVIGTRSGGTIELIQEGFSGFLYTPLNYKELAEKIRFFYENPFLIDKAGKNAQQWAEQRFTQELYGKEVSIILDEVFTKNN